MAGIIGILAGLIAVCIAVLLFAFWIWMLVDCIRNERLNDTEKVVWALVIIFLHALGALICLLVGRKR